GGNDAAIAGMFSATVITSSGRRSIAAFSAAIIHTVSGPNVRVVDRSGHISRPTRLAAARARDSMSAASPRRLSRTAALFAARRSRPHSAISRMLALENRGSIASASSAASVCASLSLPCRSIDQHSVFTAAAPSSWSPSAASAAIRAVASAASHCRVCVSSHAVRFRTLDRAPGGSVSRVAVSRIRDGSSVRTVEYLFAASAGCIASSASVMPWAVACPSGCVPHLAPVSGGVRVRAPGPNLGDQAGCLHFQRDRDLVHGLGRRGPAVALFLLLDPRQRHAGCPCEFLLAHPAPLPDAPDPFTTRGDIVLVHQVPCLLPGMT